MHAQEVDSDITFTADNASHIYLNGLRIGETWDWTKPFSINTNDSNDDNVELNSGTNVLAIAAWDGGQIAGINGEFVFEDGQRFGTSDVESWKVYNADIYPTPCNTNNAPKVADYYL